MPTDGSFASLLLFENDLAVICVTGRVGTVGGLCHCFSREYHARFFNYPAVPFRDDHLSVRSDHRDRNAVKRRMRNRIVFSVLSENVSCVKRCSIAGFAVGRHLCG